jgi:hypothetical protein
MILMLSDREGATFFVLRHDRRDGRSRYTLRQRGTRETVNIEADRDTAVPDAAVNAVTRGVPVPRDGSLFGWRYDDAVTALVPVYTAPTATSPDPFCAVMPRAGVPEVQWPPFTEEHLPGPWLWEHYWARTIISLGGFIAETPATVFWVNTKATFGTNCCVVARDLESGEDYKLRRGIYVYYMALRADTPVPSLTGLLAESDKIDLAPRFRSVDSDSWPQAVHEPVGAGLLSAWVGGPQGLS